MVYGQTKIIQTKEALYPVYPGVYPGIVVGSKLSNPKTVITHSSDIISVIASPNTVWFRAWRSRRDCPAIMWDPAEAVTSLRSQ